MCLKSSRCSFKVWKLFSCACSNRKCRARLPPLRSSGGPVESPGDDVLKERKLHYRRQCLHFAVCVLCRPVCPEPNQDVDRTRAQYLSIESAYRKVRLADALTPSEEHHDNPARRVRVRPSVPRRCCRRPSGRRDALVRRLYSDPSGVSLAHRDLMQSSGSGPRAKVPPSLAAIGGGGGDGGSRRWTGPGTAAGRAGSGDHRPATGWNQLQPDFDPRPEGRVHTASPTCGVLPNRRWALAIG